jgi:DNA-binding MarR family transcriptional regulator
MTMIAPDVERAAGQLRACLGPLVRRLRQVHLDGELTLSQVSVLVRLEREGPSTPGALAAVEQITPQSMGSILAALAQAGLVSRAHDPTDGRRVLISITPAGRESLQGVRDQRARRLARAITAALTPAEQRELIDVIPLLERVVQRV